MSTFQFTHPGRGATVGRIYRLTSERFQFTHPGRGATKLYPNYKYALTFQFTHPGRGATTRGIALEGLELDVSIHAPQEGCDMLAMSQYIDVRGFQFTHPGRGATLLRRKT